MSTREPLKDILPPGYSGFLSNSRNLCGFTFGNAQRRLKEPVYQPDQRIGRYQKIASFYTYKPANLQFNNTTDTRDYPRVPVLSHEVLITGRPGMVDNREFSFKPDPYQPKQSTAGISSYHPRLEDYRKSGRMSKSLC